ncbi:MAG: hypothetical protein NWE99_10035 [Candidatus Bathyarchaeota archaeon]|nr:hypothetical protein [Candidatus Bathyarchaeota archaeon]
MTKISTQKLITALLATFMVSASYVSLLPAVHAESQLQPLSSSDTVIAVNSQAQQIFATFMNKVAGVNMADYNIASFTASTSQVPWSKEQQTCISAVISNSQGSLSVAIILIEGKVRFYDLSLLSGSLGWSQLYCSDLMTATKKAIDNYQIYFNASYCSGFDQLIPAIIQSQNLTITENDKSLNVRILCDSASQLQYVTLEWCQSTNGLNVPMQSVQAKFSKTGILTSFADTLGLYKIATVNSVISEEQAINIAMPYINAYATQNNRQIRTVKAIFAYTNDFNGNKGDCFLIYPIWAVSAEFDGSINGVSGYCVSIWGDSGQVEGDGAQGNYQAVPTSQASENELLIIIGLIAPLAAIACVRYETRNRRWTKKAALKIGGTAVLIVGLCSLLVINPVLAYPSTILGTPYQVPSNEAELQDSITDQIAVWSIYTAGYIGYVRYPNTYASQIYQAAYDQGYGGSIVFYIGHGQSGATGIIDNSGNWISDTDIYDNSAQYSIGHHKFVMMWSCHQAENINHMPYAWLHTTSLSGDGFASPDSSGQEYIGFIGEAPFLSRSFTMNNIYRDNASYNLLMAFYWYTLTQGFSTNAALDASVQMIYSENFQQSLWYTGLPDAGRMVAFGDGNLYIGSGLRSLTVSCDPNQGSVNYASGAWFYNTPVWLTATPNYGYQLIYWLVDGQQVYGSTICVTMNQDHTVQPIFTEAPYTTTINVYYTWGGSPYYITYQYSYNVQLPYGSNYLDFTNGPIGGYFMEAYNHADSSTHYSSADTYWTGYGTSIDVLWTW